MFTPLSINPNSIVISSRDELEQEFGPFEKISKTLFRANEYAVKILPLGRAETQNEIEISNLLNSLQGVTQIFSFTHGYVINRPELYLFSNLIDAPFSALPDEAQINQDFYFEVLIGIYFARKQFQFTHYDIHEGNLMFNRLPEPTDRSYRVGATYVTIRNSRIQPKLIDYGKSAVGMGKYSDAQWKEFNKKMWNKSDIYHLSWIFAGRNELSETFRDFLQNEIIAGPFRNDRYPQKLEHDSAANTGNIERLVQVFFPVNCASCASPSPLFRCSDCLAVAYCSGKCQEAHWVAGHAMECIGGGGIKRERPEEEELDAEMSPLLKESLNDPKANRERAYRYTMSQIDKVFNNDNTNKFGGALNETNMFWYWVVFRLANQKFIPQVNYKKAAQELLRQWKEDFGNIDKVPDNETERMVESATLEQLKTTPVDQYVSLYILRRFLRYDNPFIHYRGVFMSFK